VTASGTLKSTSVNGDRTLPTEPLQQDSCLICKDEGWVRRSVPLGHPDFGQLFPCHCLKLKAKARKQSRSTLLRETGGLGTEMLRQMTFGNFDISGSVRSNRQDREILQMVYESAKMFSRNPQGWLFLTGGIGCGKTHLSVAIINERILAGEPSYFALVPALLDHLRATFKPESPISYDELFDQIKTAPFLVLDDLGSETTTPWAEEKLFQILAYRHNTRIPTVINSSESLEELEGSKPRIASRLKDILIVQWIPITAPDYRDQAAKTQSKDSRTRRPHL
jgi:DNA replication protein DnaC